MTGVCRSTRRRCALTLTGCVDTPRIADRRERSAIDWRVRRRSATADMYFAARRPAGAVAAGRRSYATTGRPGGAPSIATSRTACREASASSAASPSSFDLQLSLSQVEINAPLDRRGVRRADSAGHRADHARGTSTRPARWPRPRSPTDDAREPIDAARPRVREDQLTLRVLGVARRRLSRAADDLSVDRAARHADVHARPGPFRIDVRRSGVSGRSHQPRLARGGAAVAAAGRRGAPRGVAGPISRSGFRCRRAWAAAAATRRRRLRALARLWRVDARTRPGCADSRRRSAPTCRSFSRAAPSLGLERGDMLFPLADPPRAWVVLVLPAFGVSTREAYRWWDADQDRAGRAPDGGPARPATTCRRPVAPTSSGDRAGSSRRSRRLAPTHAAMSGSGSAVFGLFADRRTAEQRAAALVGRGRRVARHQDSQPARLRAWAARRRSSIARGRWPGLGVMPAIAANASTCRQGSPSYTLTVCATWFRATPEVSFSQLCRQTLASDAERAGQ